MKKYHNFIDRNVVLFIAIRDAHQYGVTAEDRELLESFGLKKCLMEGLPNWLVKWTCIICRYISFEEMVHYDMLKSDFPHLSEVSLRQDATN